jgi:cell fate regulator YaaT (PSP1 superfamily)
VEHLEYLLSYGLRGEFGRFRALRPLACRRGDRAVVRSHRGTEIAEVLREAVPRHAHFLPNTTVGQLLRLATDDDARAQAELRRRGDEVLRHGNALAAETGLPLEVLDVELLLDREHAVVHHLRWAECDVRPFVSTLSRTFALHVVLTDLTREAQHVHGDEESHGCGREGCGGGNCGSCGSGGCGTCGVPAAEDLTAYFGGLREQMERRRTPLL